MTTVRDQMLAVQMNQDGLGLAEISRIIGHPISSSNLTRWRHRYLERSQNFIIPPPEPGIIDQIRAIRNEIRFIFNEIIHELWPLLLTILMMIDMIFYQFYHTNMCILLIFKILVFMLQILASIWGLLFGRNESQNPEKIPIDENDIDWVLDFD